MNFWDTSAILPLVIHESTSEQTLEFFDDDGLCIWTLTPVEAMAAVCRLRREKKIAPNDQEEALAHLDRIFKGCTVVKNIERAKARALRLLRLHALKSADALQLAAALLACQDEPQEHHFVTYDNRLKEAARLEGFKIRWE